MSLLQKEDASTKRVTHQMNSPTAQPPQLGKGTMLIVL